MAEIAVSEVNTAITFVAANAGGDTVPSGVVNANHQLDGVFLLVDNADAAARTVTIDGTAYTVPAGEEHMLPVNRGVYPGQLVDVTYDAVTSTTVAAVRT